MLRFISRRTQGESFTGRRDYLKAKAGEAFDPVWICHAMERANMPLGRRYQEHGFPWMTLVLGSGCLEAREAADGLSVDDLPDAVMALLADQEELPDGSDPARLARVFTESLIEDRLGLRMHTEAPNPAEAPRSVDLASAVTQLTAPLVLATALLTRLYHQVRAARPRATSRFGDDVAVVEPELRIADEITASVLEPVRKLMGMLDKEARRDKDRMLVKIISEVSPALFSSADAPTLKLVHLRLLTELCWYYLTQQTTVYPGWSDLLLYLSAQEEKAALDRGRPRPAFSSIAAGTKPIIKRYEKVTAESWSSLVGTQRSDRDRFYETVARLLREQSRVRQNVGKAYTPPIASVFLTTFDLELEMALWANHTAPFIVAVPVNLLAEHPGRSDGDTAPRLASTCWLGCIVTPDHGLGHDDQLARLRNPHPDQWFLLSSHTRYAKEYGSMPVVVRLNGCPLLRLPPLTRDGQWTDLCAQIIKLLGQQLPPVVAESAASPLDVQHAVLLDEYAAMQQTAAEFFNYRPDQATQNAVRYGLPIEITGVEASYFARFWTVMGVQVGDSGVRYRFASQMMSPTMGSSPVRTVPDRSGVVINRRINSAVRDLLYWYGFDVVKARSEDFLLDLDHYVKHLQGPHRRSRWEDPCPIE
ncbi:MAG: hypothetical protein ACRDRG_01340 [Pseudonocardiaceae bacterium]